MLFAEALKQAAERVRAERVRVVTTATPPAFVEYADGEAIGTLTLGEAQLLALVIPQAARLAKALELTYTMQANRRLVQRSPSRTVAEMISDLSDELDGVLADLDDAPPPLDEKQGEVQ